MLRSLGIEPNSPMRIVALLNSRAVGDTIFFHIFAASVKNLFDFAELTLFQRDDRAYKNFLLEMNHDAIHAFEFAPDDPAISVDSFQNIGDIASMGDSLPGYIFNQAKWFETNAHKANLVLSPPGMPEIMLTSFEHPAYLRIPDTRVESLTRELIGHGLDPKRWFCVLNYREPGYPYRPPRPIRDLNPRPYIELVEDIITRLGGQVVRVGHPKMTPFPKREGFIDLAPLEDNFALHAFAVSRARFMVGSLTGISHLGSAVNTPTLISNCSDSIFMPGCWRDHDLALYINLYEPDGRRIPTEEQHGRDLHNRRKLLRLIQEDGYAAVQNTRQELGTAVRRLMDTTADCQGWRAPFTPAPPPDRPNQFAFPLPLRRRVPIVEYPDLAMRP